jgi:hypothetical protein
MYILWKNKKEWQFIPNNDEDYKWATVSLGFFPVLSYLENEKAKKIEEIEEINNEIDNLKEQIKERKQRLKELNEKT